MSPLQRFIQKHLRPYLVGTLGGGLILALGSSLQALSIGLLSLVFDRQFGLGNSAYFSHLFSFKWALGLVSK